MSTVFIRHKKERDYTVVDNLYLRDNSLSWKAKGVFTYLLSLPEDWEVHLEEIENHAPDGRDSLRAAVRELKSKGYIVLRQKKDAAGKFSKNELEIVERPDLPQTENPSTGKPSTENPKLLNTNKQSTYKTNNNTGEPKGSGKKKKEPDEISQLYHETVRKLNLPVRNYNNLRSCVKRLETEIGKTKALDYLNFISTNYQSLNDDGFKPRINEALDIYSKRVALQTWIERMINSQQKPKEAGGRPIF